MDTLSLGLFILVNHHYNYHYLYQHQYHGRNCPLVTSSFINILFKDHSCSLSSKSQSVPSSLLIIMIIVIIKIIIIVIIVIMLRMLNPLVNLCENGFSASQIVSAIKVLFHRMHMYFKRDPQKKRKYSFSWSIFGLSSIFQTADQPILVQAVQIFQMLSKWPNEIILLCQIYYHQYYIHYIIYILNIFKAWCLMLTGYVHPPCYGWNSLKSSNYIQKEEEISNLCINKYIFAYFWHPRVSSCYSLPFWEALPHCYISLLSGYNHNAKTSNEQ